ncbi:hypothetical protein M23134_04038 [Microscilla marina ATCC 23134]|uniref:Uncharacterized protein n=1 Tax=Microscilla marina ATCC 23134 TaxID=313606 RepID=A1ZMU5_MICM2|nr:hypothetical protein M23134_04038 [Microscilla marina ATCC 23134]
MPKCFDFVPAVAAVGQRVGLVLFLPQPPGTPPPKIDFQQKTEVDDLEVLLNYLKSHSSNACVQHSKFKIVYPFFEKTESL